MVKLISHTDTRQNFEHSNRCKVAKLWYHHVRMFGLGSATIEEDGVELDPVEDCGISQEMIDELEQA
jgi:hypothetical protein